MRFRDCSYFLMFRPPSLLASRIAPTAVSFPTGQLRRLHPSRTCVVAFARIGYAIGRLQAINRTGTLTPLAVSAGLKGIHFRRFALSHLSEGLPWGTPTR